MTLPNEFQAPTAANLARATITELAVYVYQTALNFTGNAEYAESVLREFVTRAEAAAEDARNIVTDAVQIAAQTIRDIVSADADRAAASAQSARESEQNAAESATNATDAADRAEAAARTAADDAVAEAVPAAADAIRAEVQADAASAASAATRAETAAQSAETSEGVCNSYAGGAAISAENAAQSAADAAESAADAQSAASNAASEFDAEIDAKIAAALGAFSIGVELVAEQADDASTLDIAHLPDGLYLVRIRNKNDDYYGWGLLPKITGEAVYADCGCYNYTNRTRVNAFIGISKFGAAENITFNIVGVGPSQYAGCRVYKIAEFGV